MPLFTDMEELNKKPTTNININVPIRKIVEEGVYNDKVSGIVINPFGDALPVPGEVLKLVLREKEDE